MLQNNPTLKSLIDKLWNNFWSGGIANPLTAIEQITYLLFMKQLDENETKLERDVNDGFLEEKDVEFRFKGSYTPSSVKSGNEAIDKKELRWSFFKHMPSDEMLLHVQTKVFPFLKELNSETSPFTKHMKNAVFIIPNGRMLVSAINIVEEIFTEIERDARESGQVFQDIQGDVYEMLLSEIAAAGKNGQFRTPRHIIKLMSELAEPQLGQKVADPACGTGGFLLGAYQYILTDLVRKKDPSRLVKDEDGFERATVSSVLTEKVKNILQDSFYGYDIDATMVRLGLMNLMMHGIDEPQIDYRDTLSKNYNEESQFDVVMANPPFTGNIDKGNINENLRLPTTKTELLFVERILNMLKIGGTAAVIVPSGVVQNSGKAFDVLREMLVKKTELRAIIAMPSGVFKPYAGVSTTILLFTKGGQTTDVWFYNMEADGYSLDDKRTKVQDSDLMDIVNRFKSTKNLKENDRTQKCFFVNRKEIEANNFDLNLSSYVEEVFDDIIYEKPTVILQRLGKLENRINEGLEELKILIK